MKKTLRKYQAGSLPSYTGMSTSPTYQIPTTPAPLPATLPRVTNISPTTTGFSEQPKSNVGSTVAGAAMGVAGSVMSGISTANSAQANIDAAKRAKAKRDEAKRNIAAFKSENLSDPDAVREYTQMQNSTYNREDASLDVGRMQSEAQEEISKNTTIAATSAIPIVGPLVSGITALTWGLLGDAEEEQYQKQLANRRSSSPTSVGGTSEETRPDSMFAKYGGKMPTYQMGGSRSYQKPNAELEDGEVIMRNGGRNEMVEGDTHEEGGEDKYLAPGDFVWSDHLKYQGKSMAELYLMVKDIPEKVEQLKALQENLASKEKPSKYNDLPQKKYGGMELPQYKKGTPATAVPTGVNSKSKTWFNEYGEYILPAASAVGQIVNLALAKDPYENLDVPTTKTIGSHQQISLARTNAQAELDANAAGATDARRSALYTGAGPGSTAIYQTIANQQAGLNSKAQTEANRINMSIAAEEANLNVKDKLERESFNANAANENAKLAYDKNVNQAAYKAATTASYGNIFAGIANDAQSFMRDKAVARSITRGTNIDSNRYAMNVEAIEKAARDEETANAAKAGRDFSEDEYLKLRTKKIGDASTYISTRK